MAYDMRNTVNALDPLEPEHMSMRRESRTIVL